MSFKISYDISHHKLNKDNYFVFSDYDVGSFYGATKEDDIKEVVEFMQENSRYEYKDKKRGYGETYFSVSFSSTEEIIDATPFSYEDIVDSHPEYFV